MGVFFGKAHNLKSQSRKFLKKLVFLAKGLERDASLMFHHIWSY
jgi:hypothetical protein